MKVANQHVSSETFPMSVFFLLVQALKIELRVTIDNDGGTLFDKILETVLRN